MKRFIVTLEIPTHYDWQSTPISWAEVRIMADYMKIENGHLIFREDTVRVFAPGAWREVIELS